MALKPIPIKAPQWDAEKNQLSEPWLGYELALRATISDEVAPNSASYIVRTASSSLSNEQALSTLSTGFVKVTTGTGVLSSSGSSSIETTDIAALAVTTAKIDNLAVTTAKIDADAVTNAKIADAQVSLEHLDSGIAPSHYVKYAGSFTTVGGDANEVITVSGCTSSDLAFVGIKTKGGTPRTLVAFAAATDQINVELSGDPSTDHVLVYQVLRAAS